MNDNPAEPTTSNDVVTLSWHERFKDPPMTVRFRFIRESPKIAKLYELIKERGYNAAGEYPIPLPGLSARSLETFLTFVQSDKESAGTQTSNSSVKFSREDIIDVIAVAQCWQLRNLATRCTNRLDLKNQSPTFQLHVASNFHLSSVVSGAVTELILTDLNDWIEPELLPIGIYHTMSRAREAIQCQRLNIATLFPTIASFPAICKQHDICQDEWRLLWATHVAKQLSKSKPRVSVLACRDALIDVMDKNSVIAKGCLHHMKDDLTLHPNWKPCWEAESVIIDQVIKRVTEMVMEGE
ncbi:hypothetical protein BJ165DRAFT_1401344 [Panaeolus papilionaceus]|nr:hypothetical protein BJ165DRAFT_1401344 [Panaeolus papilionaceus]